MLVDIFWGHTVDVHVGHASWEVLPEQSQKKGGGSESTSAASQEEHWDKLRVLNQLWGCLQLFDRDYRQFSVTAGDKR